MIPLFKGLIPAIVLTWVVTGIMGSNGSKGGFLFIHPVHLAGNSAYSIPAVDYYWSWPLFFATAVLGFFIFKMLE